MILVLVNKTPMFKFMMEKGMCQGSPLLLMILSIIVEKPIHHWGIGFLDINLIYFGIIYLISISFIIHLIKKTKFY